MVTCTSPPHTIAHRDSADHIDIIRSIPVGRATHAAHSTACTAAPRLYVEGSAKVWRYQVVPQILTPRRSLAKVVKLLALDGADKGHNGCGGGKCVGHFEEPAGEPRVPLLHVWGYVGGDEECFVELQIHGDAVCSVGADGHAGY